MIPAAATSTGETVFLWALPCRPQKSRCGPSEHARAVFVDVVICHRDTRQGVHGARKTLRPAPTCNAVIPANRGLRQLQRPSRPLNRRGHTSMPPSDGLSASAPERGKSGLRGRRAEGGSFSAMSPRRPGAVMHVRNVRAAALPTPLDILFLEIDRPLSRRPSSWTDGFRTFG